MRKYYCLSGFLLLLMSKIVLAAIQIPQVDKPIPVNDAFSFSAQVKNDHSILAHWQIAPGYHLYRDRFNFKILTPKTAKLDKVKLPAGTLQQDDILGTYQVYSHTLTLLLKLQNIQSQQATLTITYQGCANSGFCYPPVTKKLAVDFSQTSQVITAITDINGLQFEPTQQPIIAEQDKITHLLKQDNIWLILIGFFGFGLLLAFTPCVLPMIPILSGIIVGHGHRINTNKGLRLSVAYVLGMAVTYAIAGVIVAMLGANIQTSLQNPWVLSIFSLIFILLALSLFGLYDLRLPHGLQQKIYFLSRKQAGGNYIGVVIMGSLSTLIVSPCITPPLVGVLAYIAQTGDSVLGGTALFTMALGMGLPLIIVGTTGGKFLPKTGGWMVAIKNLFGVLLLAVAIYLLERILPANVSLLAWAALFVVSAVYLGALSHVEHGWQKFWKGIGLLLLIYGILMMVGAALGNEDPLQPLGKLPLLSVNQPANQQKLQFTQIKNINDLKQQLQLAQTENKLVMLDFYADWCTACKEMEQNTFSHPDVKRALANFIVLQADVTANSLSNKTLEKQLGVIAPPTILFFGADGQEKVKLRVIGKMGPDAFLKRIRAVQNS